VASPIAHSFAGFWTFLVLAKQLKIRLAAQWRQYLPQLGVLIMLANLADVDFLMELAFKGEYHRVFTHSLAAAVFVALALSCVWQMAKGFWRSAMLYFTAYGSHLLIDFCTGTELGWNNSGSGIPLFWPLTKEFGSPLILVFGIRHKNLTKLFGLDNMWAGIYELLVFGAITAVILALRARFVLFRTPTFK
jgi:membrane-bound metal-dependent hydrolase YbcI (DUF457 family)